MPWREDLRSHFICIAQHMSENNDVKPSANNLNAAIVAASAPGGQNYNNFHGQTA